MVNKGDNTNSKLRFYSSIKQNADGRIVEYSENNFLNDLHKRLILDSLKIANQVHMNWSIKENNEHKYRKMGLGIFIFVFFLQLIVLNALVFMQGINVIKLNDNTLYAYIAIVFVEIIGIVAITFKYIFSERSINPLEVAYKIIDSANKYNNIYYKENISLNKIRERIQRNEPSTFDEKWETETIVVDSKKQ